MVLAAGFAGGMSSSVILDALSTHQERADVRDAIDGWGRLADEGREVLNDPAALGALMNEAQALYDAIELPELAAPKLHKARERIADLCTGSKFTGAGGDRSLVAVFADLETQAEAGRRLHEMGLVTVS